MDNRANDFFKHELRGITIAPGLQERFKEVRNSNGDPCLPFEVLEVHVSSIFLLACGSHDRLMCGRFSGSRDSLLSADR